MSDAFRDNREFWDRHAKRDPLWAILSDPAKSGRRWDLNDFLATGRREISLLMYQLHSLGVEVRRDAALDFGCGIGRLSQPLAAYFDRVVGLDISPEMVKLASEINQQRDKVHYISNGREDLSLFANGEFTFAYSNVVLQHIEQDAAIGYLRELLRVLSPGGVLVFQLPSHRRPVEDRRATAGPMPAEAYRASLNVLGQLPVKVAPEAEIVLDVTVTNLGSCSWSQADAGPIRLGNHWLRDHSNEMLIQDDGRSALPSTLAVGETCRLSLTVTAPAEPGEYCLECDVVHEGVSWFADRGSRTWRCPVVIEGSQTAGQPAEPDQIPPAPGLDLPVYIASSASDSLPMHGIHSSLVAALVVENRGEVIHREIDERCGEEWIGYRYFVRRI